MCARSSCIVCVICMPLLAKRLLWEATSVKRRPAASISEELHWNNVAPAVVSFLSRLLHFTLNSSFQIEAIPSRLAQHNLLCAFSLGRLTVSKTTQAMVIGRKIMSLQLMVSCCPVFRLLCCCQFSKSSLSRVG